MPITEFIASPQFEVAYALAILAEPEPPIHAAWCGKMRDRLGGGLHERLARYGDILWLAFPDTLGGERPVPDTGSLLDRVHALDHAAFQHQALLGLLHDESVVSALVSGRAPTREALARLPAAKREWLAYVGLFPYSPDTPAGALIDDLVESPDEVCRHAAGLVEEFCDAAFAATWEDLRPQLERSRDRAERLFASCSLGEFAAAMRLLVEVGSGGQELRALRGGYRTRLDALEAMYFLPSAFNHRRFWTELPAPRGDRGVAFFPFFDHEIELGVALVPRTARRAPAEADPALVCKALGDATRFSMLSLIAERPRTAGELAREIGLSKPTISHHLFQLRAAGLLDERPFGNAVELRIDRRPLDTLSGRLADRLFGGDCPKIKKHSKKHRRKP